MSATIIDGKAFAATLRETITHEVAELNAKHNITPGLAVVLVGQDAASQVYVRNKEKQTIACGMESFAFKLPSNTTEDALIKQVKALNNDDSVHGILVQLPLPSHINENAVIEAIDPDKDVDGFHVINTGRLATNQAGLVPCTPYGCLLMLKDHLGDLSGKNAIVLGRSNIVGKPMAQLLLNESCTVTIAHSRTTDIEAKTREADIVVAAIGRPHIVTKDWLKADAVVIDVGINRITDDEGNTKLVGDVDFDEVKDHVRAITPVPGGVGPMTIACLLRNTLVACCTQHSIQPPAL